MTADRIVLIVIIAALVAERLWSVPEPKTKPPVQEQSASPEHAYMPARLYVRRCAGEGKEFVIHQSDGGPMRAYCVKTPQPDWSEP